MTIYHDYWLLSGGLRGPQRALGGNWCQRQWFSFTCRSHKGLHLLLWQYLPSLSKFSALFIFNIYPYCITVLCFVRRFPNNWHQGVRDVIAVDELFDCIPAINRFKCFQFLRKRNRKWHLTFSHLNCALKFRNRNHIAHGLICKAPFSSISNVNRAAMHWIINGIHSRLNCISHIYLLSVSTVSQKYLLEVDAPAPLHWVEK